MTKRIRLRIAYDGTNYHGWQQQPDCVTVEGSLIKAASRLLAIPYEEVIFQGASRTDSGVHALGQTAHIDHDTDRGLWDFVRGLNALTEDDICVLHADEVGFDFNARHSSRGKTYRYNIWNHRFQHPLKLTRSWNVRKPLDLDAMREAAALLVGEHDFAAFRASDCQAQTTVREITAVKIFTTDELGADITIQVEGTAFLKYMVRIISGTLVEIGKGRLAPDIITQMFEQKDRALGGTTAPPHGLTLVSVHYPDHPWADGDEPVIGGPWMA